MSGDLQHTQDGSYLKLQTHYSLVLVKCFTCRISAKVSVCNFVYFLTCLLLLYECILLLNQALSRYFHATLQLHNSLVDCARELFKSSKDSVSLLVCSDKKF